MYVIVNDFYIDVNGKSIKFGIVAEDFDTFKTLYLTLKEIEDLKKEGLFDKNFKDEGWKYSTYSQEFGITGNKISKKIPKRYIEQLEYMGYDISQLEYELKEK